MGACATKQENPATATCDQRSETRPRSQYRFDAAANQQYMPSGSSMDRRSNRFTGDEDFRETPNRPIPKSRAKMAKDVQRPRVNYDLDYDYESTIGDSEVNTPRQVRSGNRPVTRRDQGNTAAVEERLPRKYFNMQAIKALFTKSQPASGDSAKSARNMSESKPRKEDRNMSESKASKGIRNINDKDTQNSRKVNDPIDKREAKRIKIRQSEREMQ